MSFDEIKKNYEQLKVELAEVNLLAVSKKQDIQKVKDLYQLGHRDFGENKVQELQLKAEQLQDLTEIRWHFIGHLQSNKVKSLLSTTNLVSIHSIDTIKLLNKILKIKPDKNIGLFLQINTSSEREKSGFRVMNEVEEAIELIMSSKDYKLQGLMTMGSIRGESFERDAKTSFAMLQNLQKKIYASKNSTIELSMGMSNDYKIAMQYDTNWVRIGSKLFGNRK